MDGVCIQHKKVIRLVNGRKDFLIPIRNDADMHTRFLYTPQDTQHLVYVGAVAARCHPRLPAICAV